MVMAVVAAGTFSQEITLEGVNANLQQLKAHHFLSEVPPQEIAALKRTATSFSQASDSWAAILQLWVAGQHDFVELLWWQKDDPETRAFIVSLEWCTVTLPDKRSGIWPAGIHNYERMSERFEPTERALRIREIDFVRQNRQTLAKQLGAILLANHIQMAEQYKTVAEQATPRNQD
jgi:hypothetical protein